MKHLWFCQIFVYFIIDSLNQRLHLNKDGRYSGYLNLHYRISEIHKMKILYHNNPLPDSFIKSTKVGRDSEQETENLKRSEKPPIGVFVPSSYVEAMFVREIKWLISVYKYLLGSLLWKLPYLVTSDKAKQILSFRGSRKLSYQTCVFLNKELLILIFYVIRNISHFDL